MVFGSPTTPEEVLGSISQQIKQADVVPSQLVFATLALDDNLKELPPADLFITIKPSSFRVRSGDQTGAGRRLLTIESRWEIAVWCRLDLDLVGQSTAFISNQTYGILARFRAVLNSLEQFSPMNGSGLSSFAEPMRLVTFDFAPRPVKPGWSKLSSSWDLQFVMRLD